MEELAVDNQTHDGMKSFSTEIRYIKKERVLVVYRSRVCGFVSENTSEQVYHE